MRLLLVEDEKKVSDLVARALRAERYAVDVADDGLQGWQLAESYDYDLIILDLMLPGLPGTEVLRRIRRKNHQVPILILTARDATEEKVDNFEAGADDYLTKPFSMFFLLFTNFRQKTRSEQPFQGRTMIMMVQVICRKVTHSTFL